MSWLDELFDLEWKVCTQRENIQYVVGIITGFLLGMLVLVFALLTAR
jgi:uncharacterized integral membrane protein